MEVSMIFFFGTLQVLLLELIYLLFLLRQKNLWRFGLMGCILAATYGVSEQLLVWWYQYRPEETTAIEWVYENFVLPNVQAVILMMAGFSLVFLICKLFVCFLKYMSSKKREEDEWESGEWK